MLFELSRLKKQQNMQRNRKLWHRGKNLPTETTFISKGANVRLAKISKQLLQIYWKKKKLKEIMLKELKEGMVTVSHQIENIEKETNS